MWHTVPRTCIGFNRIVDVRPYTEEAHIDGMRERKRADNRAATIEVAFRLFGEHGYDNVTVAAICEAADIGRRTFFRYFASKEELLNVPLQEMTARLDQSLAATPAGSGEREAVRSAMLDLADYALAHRRQLGLYRRIITSSADRRFDAFWHLPQQEQRFARQVRNRHGGAAEPGLHARLLVARAVAAFRVWLDEAVRGNHDLPADEARALFHHVLDADPWLAGPVPGGGPGGGTGPGTDPGPVGRVAGDGSADG
jgi:AcrR family transcriptional regulator